MPYQKRDLRDFPGGPGVRAHSQWGGSNLILGHMSQATTKTLNAAN